MSSREAPGGIISGKRARFRQRLLLITQADENGGIVMIADPRKTPRDGLGGRSRTGAMRRDNLGNSFGHEPPRSIWSKIAWPGFAIADCTPEGLNACANESKRQAIVYIGRVMSNPKDIDVLPTS